jgi:hypothetical protein
VGQDIQFTGASQRPRKPPFALSRRTTDACISATVDENILGKRTQTTRQRTAKRLTELYSLDPTCTVFRLLRHFWPADRIGQPMLAFLAAGLAQLQGGGQRRGGHVPRLADATGREGCL